ncbi:MAG: acyl-CoA dehydrogenase family protein [Acidobacteriota bacterium]
MSDEPLTSPTELEARDVAEDARENRWEHPSFALKLFLGRLRMDLIHPFPELAAEEETRGQDFLARLESFLLEHVDGDAIDRHGKVPESVVEGLRKLGAFGIKTPPKYGGLGLSQLTYVRAVHLVASRCASTAALLSAHQSIGVPQPLMLFGTEEQKRRFLPRLARGEISAFALTEPDAGSDPAAMKTTATPSEDGRTYVLNGEKLWCTNGPVADILVVMARTPSKMVRGRERQQITAFIVEATTPGFEISHRCHFMGLNAIENGVLRLRDVRVPRENILWGEGLGLKLALITLNTGRLTLPATCAASAKVCLKVSRRWAAEREQWGVPIGKHEAVAAKLGSMAADTFAMEAVSELASGLASLGGRDIRLEAAIAKMYNSETGWRIVDDAMQIRAGRGYEKADSLAARGEPRIPIERMMRDFRINMIFEGTSEIMRLFIAREAVDPHLQVAGALADPRSSTGQRLRALGPVLIHYAVQYPALWIGWGRWPRYSGFGKLARHVRYMDRTSRRLARSIIYCIALYQAKLEKKQAMLGRLVDIGSELFAMAASCSRASMLEQKGPWAIAGRAGARAETGSRVAPSATALADLFCRQARRRIKEHFRALFRNDDVRTYRLAQQILRGEHTWLECGVLDPSSAPAPVVPDTPVGTPR